MASPSHPGEAEATGDGAIGREPDRHGGSNCGQDPGQPYTYKWTAAPGTAGTWAHQEVADGTRLSRTIRRPRGPCVCTAEDPGYHLFRAPRRARRDEWPDDLLLVDPREKTTARVGRFLLHLAQDRQAIRLPGG